MSGWRLGVGILKRFDPFDNFDGLLGTKQRMGAYMCSSKAFLPDWSVQARSIL
jgi:hypothetical protein